MSPRFYNDSAFTSWRPVDRDLPEGLRASWRNDRREKGFALPTRNSEERAVPPEFDAEAMFQDVVAEQFEQHSRRKVRSASAPALDISQVAQRMGVTPKAVRKSLAVAPLENVCIAMSLSDAQAADGKEDSRAAGLADATKHLARPLVAAGASIAYGGDFRLGGFTFLLAELIKAYNETGARREQHLHGFLAATISLGEVP